MIPGWTTTSVESAVGGQRLDVWHPLDDDSWVETAVRYWRGEIEGLERLRSSKAAVVERGSLGDGPDVFFKRFLLRGVRDRLKHLIRPSRGRRALLGGELIREAGFHAPRSFCCVEARRGGIVRESALFSESVDGAPDLLQWFSRPELGLLEDFSSKRRFILRLAQEVGKWHGRGLYHGDMRFGNILCRPVGEDFEFWWLDNERNRRFDCIPWNLRIQNLVQVNTRRLGVTLADRLRFWREYLKHAELDPREEKRMIAQVRARTQQRWRKRGWL